MNISDKIELVKIEELYSYHNNPKEHPIEQINKIASSIKHYGFVQPLVIDSENEIIIGHGRLEAAKKLKLKEVPVIVKDDLTDVEIKALRLADNKIAESDWNMEMLEVELEELEFEDYDMGLTGFDEKELKSMLDDDSEVEEDDFDAEIDEENIISKLGDVIELGRHRLVCGDSTSEEDINVLMNGEKADMVFTDPPYGMKKENEGVLNDNLNYDDLLDFNRKWIPKTFDNIKDVGSWYCWGTDEPLMDIYSEILKPMIKKQEATFRNLITWDKEHGQGQLAEEFRMYPVADEKCLFVMKGVQGVNTNKDNYFEDWEPIRKYLDDEMKAMGWSSKRVSEFFGFHPRMVDHWRSKSQFELLKKEQYERLQQEAKGKGFKKEYEEIKKEYDSTRAYFDNTHDNMNNVWHFNRASNEEKETTGEHATPKPIELCSRGIKSSSRNNEIILDVFGGSGSTLIACEQLNRICYMMELDEKYCDVIIQRYINYRLDNDKEVNIEVNGEEVVYQKYLVDVV